MVQFGGWLEMRKAGPIRTFRPAALGLEKDMEGAITMARWMSAVDLAAVKVPGPRKYGPAKWGKWRLVRKMGRLVYGDFFYAIDLERCLDSAQVLDWIMQLHGKRWISDEDMRDLLRAFHDLLDPQANMCSFGINRKDAPQLSIQRLQEWGCKISKETLRQYGLLERRPRKAADQTPAISGECKSGGETCSRQQAQLS